MRVEHCGDLLVEPSSLRQQPSTISSHCSDHHHQSTKNIRFSELNHLEDPGEFGCKEEYILGRREQGCVFGFTINEEEWSLFSKSHLADLEPYERKKMCSLPKSFTPFSSTVGDGGLESDRNLNRSASNSILLRKCESLNPTPSQFLVNGSEPNNNNIAHPSSLSKMLLLQKSQEGFQEDEKENWLGDEGWDSNETSVVDTTNTNTETSLFNDSAPDGSFGKDHGLLMWEPGLPVGHGQSDFKDREVELEFLPTARFPVAHASTFVGTIGSHPNPIISCAADQTHYHQHQDLSTTQQQASFPSTVYNFHSIDPLLFAECYDAWNANAGSLCENGNAEATSVLYPDVMSINGYAMQTQPHPEAVVAVGSGPVAARGAPESGFRDYTPYSGENDDLTGETIRRVAEEVNPLSTFLSKFDDKVAAIWGQQGNARCPNLLSVDGCISSASTPLGSSNPWGSPSSDISATHGPPTDYRFQAQQQHSKQMSKAADALLSGGFGLHQHHDHFQCEQQQIGNAVSGNKLAVGDMTAPPPKGNYNIMHSMKQYFGTAPPEGEYHIIKRADATSSSEELEKSLALINHCNETAGFAAHVYTDKLERQPDLINLSTITNALDCLELESEVDDEWEIVEACNKGKAQSYDGEDLLTSWKTHFRTIEHVETVSSTRGMVVESPVTTISAHQINHNLPEYRLFDIEEDGEYRVFNRTGQTMFPVKYKVCRQYEKGNQTEDCGVDVSSPVDAAVDVYQAYKMATDWSKYLSVPPFELSHGALGTLPRSTTPVDPRTATAIANDCGDNGVDYQALDWYNMPKGVEYNGMWGEWIVGGDDTSQTVLAGGGEYCDSGVGGVGSRSDFYDDMFGEYEGEYENLSGIGFTFPGFVTTTDADTDYGQFHDVTGLTGCDSSSVYGKHGKSNRRNKARLRPCKYFFMEGSCRRGNDCKFSHDSITCRYWAEGSCLKGQTCPYVHCFIDGKKLSNQEDYGIRNNGSEKHYHLESETDFPALSSTKNTMLSSRQPMSLGFSSSVGVGDGIRRLEDSLESLTVFTDSNSSVMDEEVTETRRLFLFERLRASPPLLPATFTTGGTEKLSNMKAHQNGDSIASSNNKVSSKTTVGNHRGGSEYREWSDAGNRSLSKSKSLGDTNSSAPWLRHSVSRSSSHSSTTGLSLGIPVKEKRKKKKH